MSIRDRGYRKYPVDTETEGEFVDRKEKAKMNIDTNTKGRIDFDDIGWFAACPNCDTLFRRKKENIVGGTTEDRVKKLKEITKVQCQEGNYDRGEYMRGMANGLILAVATIENKKPQYIPIPVDNSGNSEDNFPVLPLKILKLDIKKITYNPIELLVNKINTLIDVINDMRKREPSNMPKEAFKGASKRVNLTT